MSYERWGLPKPNPHDPPGYDEPIVMAMRAFATGTANSGQQQDVLDYIQYVCGVGKFQDLSYRPGDQHATSFAQGKACAGLQIMKMLNPLTLEIVQRKNPKARSKGK
jgi:hypothetical protein